MRGFKSFLEVSEGCFEKCFGFLGKYFVKYIFFVFSGNLMAGWMDGWMDRLMDGWIDGWMDRLMDGWIDGWMDGWMDG